MASALSKIDELSTLKTNEVHLLAVDVLPSYCLACREHDFGLVRVFIANGNGVVVVEGTSGAESMGQIEGDIVFAKLLVLRLHSKNMV